MERKIIKIEDIQAAQRMLAEQGADPDKPIYLIVGEPSPDQREVLKALVTECNEKGIAVIVSIPPHSNVMVKPDLVIIEHKEARDLFEKSKHEIRNQRQQYRRRQRFHKGKL